MNKICSEETVALREVSNSFYKTIDSSISQIQVLNSAYQACKNENLMLADENRKLNSEVKKMEKEANLNNQLMREKLNSIQISTQTQIEV